MALHKAHPNQTFTKSAFYALLSIWPFSYGKVAKRSSANSFSAVSTQEYIISLRRF